MKAGWARHGKMSSLSTLMMMVMTDWRGCARLSVCIVVVLFLLFSSSYFLVLGGEKSNTKIVVDLVGFLFFFPFLTFPGHGMERKEGNRVTESGV